MQDFLIEEHPGSLPGTVERRKIFLRKLYPDDKSALEQMNVKVAELRKLQAQREANDGEIKSLRSQLAALTKVTDAIPELGDLIEHLASQSPTQQQTADAA